MPEASYLALNRSGQLASRVGQLLSQLSNCNLCPRRCGVNRFKGELGQCRTGRYARVSSHGPHFGEEPPLVGRGGSGTIFFTNCNLACVYCQNHDISQLGRGFEVTPERLAQVMIDLQTLGCHNVNFVSPTHVVAQIVESLAIAIGQGLTLPLVYNTGGYDDVSTLGLLNGVIDIYMPDAKYGDDATGLALSAITGYFSANRLALKEMHRQVGDLLIENDIAPRGLLVRHLVLPGQLAQTDNIMHFIADEISKETYVNVMEQYRPAYKAELHPTLNRPLRVTEYRQALEAARSAGLHRFA